MQKPYIVLVTGSRGYPIVTNGHQKLNDGRLKLPSRRIEVWHGECLSGPDAMAKVWVRRTGEERIKERGWRAHWEIYGNRAGPERNTEMVNGGPNLCLAFFAPCESPRCPRRDPHWSHGTTDCARKAKDAGIGVIPSFWRRSGTPDIPIPAWLR